MRQGDPAVPRALKVTSQVSVIGPPSSPTNANMSATIPVLGPSREQECPLTGSQDKGEGSGGLNQEDLEIAPSGAPTLREKCSSGRCPDSAVADDTRENRKSAAYAMAKSILGAINESPSSYPPLRSIAEHLWHVLDKCEVCPPPPHPTYNPDNRYSEQK